MTQSPSGLKLTADNELIIRTIAELKSQHKEMCQLLQKQEEERAILRADMDRIAYKLLLLDKSIAQRTKNVQRYEASR